jgi:hypothetical protein
VLPVAFDEFQSTSFQLSHQRLLTVFVLLCAQLLAERVPWLSLAIYIGSSASYLPTQLNAVGQSSKVKCQPSCNDGLRLNCDIQPAKANGGNHAKRSSKALRSGRPVYIGTSRADESPAQKAAQIQDSPRSVARLVEGCFSILDTPLFTGSFWPEIDYVLRTNATVTGSSIQ